MSSFWNNFTRSHKLSIYTETHLILNFLTRILLSLKCEMILEISEIFYQNGTVTIAIRRRTFRPIYGLA